MPQSTVFFYTVPGNFGVCLNICSSTPLRESRSFCLHFFILSSFDRREGLFSSNCYCKPFWDINALISKGSNRISWIKHFALFPMTCCTCISGAAFAEFPSYRSDKQNNSKCYRHIKFFFGKLWSLNSFYISSPLLIPEGAVI